MNLPLRSALRSALRQTILGLGLALLLAPLSGCAPGSFSMKITVDPLANANYPVALSVLVIYDKAVLPKLQEMNARQWFGQREQFLRDNAKVLSEDYFEFVPGQSVKPLQRSLRDKAAGALVFANYRTPGAHRYVFDPTHENQVTLGQKGVVIEDKTPVSKGFGLPKGLPTELPEGAPEIPNPLQ